MSFVIDSIDKYIKFIIGIRILAILTYILVFIGIFFLWFLVLKSCIGIIKGSKELNSKSVVIWIVVTIIAITLLYFLFNFGSKVFNGTKKEALMENEAEKTFKYYYTDLIDKEIRDMPDVDTMNNKHLHIRMNYVFNDVQDGEYCYGTSDHDLTFRIPKNKNDKIKLVSYINVEAHGGKYKQIKEYSIEISGEEYLKYIEKFISANRLKVEEEKNVHQYSVNNVLENVVHFFTSEKEVNNYIENINKDLIKNGAEEEQRKKIIGAIKESKRSGSKYKTINIIAKDKKVYFGSQEEFTKALFVYLVNQEPSSVKKETTN